MSKGQNPIISSSGIHHFLRATAMLSAS